jgi:hypothetical protein
MINVAWDGTNTQKSLYSAFPHDISITNQFKVPFYAGWPLVALSIFLSITFFGLILLVGLLLFPYVAPLLIVWFSFLLAYWPGTLNSDAMIQWLQTISGDYVDWQPVFHTLTMEFLNHIWYSPAAVAITQILGLSVVVGYSLHSFKQHNAPKWVPWVVVGLLVFTPVNGFLVISLYKDIPFSIFILLLSVLILKIIISKGGWLKSKWNLVLLGLTFILVTLYRQNGVTVPLGSVVLVGLFFPRYWKQLLGCTIVFLLVYFVVKGPIYDQLGVQKRDMQRGEKVMLNIVASQIHEGTYLSPSEQNLVQRLFHIDGYNYDCYRNTQLFTNINKSVEITNYVEENSKAIYLLAFDLTVRSPMPTLKYFDCVSSFVLKVVQPKKSYYSFGSRDIFTNDIGLVTNSRLPGLKKFLDEWDTFAQKPQFSWFFFRSGFWLYLSVATCLLYCYLKKSWLYFLVLIPSLAAVLPMALISVSQYVRYAYPVNLCGTIFSVYFLGMSLQNLWQSYRGRVTKNLSEN